MEETSEGKIEVILRLHQVLEDFQAVRRELREVLGIMTSWDGSGVAAASDLGWPHEESLKRDIRQWLLERVRPEEENQPELSRAVTAGGEELRVSARHVLEDFWLVSIRRAARGQDGRAGDAGGGLTAVAVVRVSPEAESPSTGARTAAAPESGGMSRRGTGPGTVEGRTNTGSWRAPGCRPGRTASRISWICMRTWRPCRGWPGCCWTGGRRRPPATICTVGRMSSWTRTGGSGSPTGPGILAGDRRESSSGRGAEPVAAPAPWRERAFRLVSREPTAGRPVRWSWSYPAAVMA